MKTPFTVTKIGEIQEIKTEFWKAYNEGQRIQTECGHKNATRYHGASAGVVYMCDDCSKCWNEDSQKTS